MATSIWKQQSNFNLGTILLGSDYDFLTAYNINDVVSFNGTTFRAIKDNPLVGGQSILPRNLDYWTEFNVEITEGDTFDILLPVNLGSNTTVLQTSAFGGDSTFTDFDNTRFYISSIGIPEHAFGPYPNPQNSFSVDIQNWLFTLPIEPAVAITKVDTPVGPVGIASNGVPIYNHKSSKIDNVEGEALTRNSVLSIQNGAVVVDGSGPPSVLGDYHYLKDPQLLYFKPTNYKELYDDSISYSINQIVSYNNDFWVSNLQSPGSLIVNSNRIVTYARDSKYGFAVNSAVNTFTVGTRSGDVEVPKTTNNVSVFDRENTEFVNTFERDWINYISGVQHSPIIGYALDGYPIYGSLGYSDPLDANSYPKFMTSGYSVRSDNRQNGDTRDGYYEEDWAWIENSGTLDIHNGRFCVTPEYPAGTYAYFASVETDAPAVSTYPYLIGKQFYGEPLLDNGTGIREGLNDVTFNVISGELPLGLRIDRQRLRGTPLEIANTTDYDFVIRAKYNSDQVVEDRTFKLTVEGPDDPVWLTAEGNLAVGSNNTFFVLDGDFVDINLLATDDDIAAGQELEFFIGDDSGELPPGLTLTSEGRIFGFTDPVIPLDYNAVTGGGYGSDRYDYNPYDYAIRSQSGYDSFLYDNIGYDEADATRSPRKANRFYEFIVSVNDGDSIARRQFKIFVVGDDAARADNVSSNSDQEIFTADMTFVRKPIFTTPSNLGVKRAGSFITLVIDVFDPNTIIGPIDYQLEPVNVDGSPSILPTGLTLDYITGEVAGRYPYQPEVTREFNFTIRATRYNPNVADVEVSYGYVASAFAVGDTQVLFDPTKSVSLLDTVGSTIYDPVKRKNIEVIAVEEIEQNSVNYVRVTFGQALEFANPNPSTDQMSFAFSTTVLELSNDEYISERKQFTLRVQGEADGAISWITPSDLGNIAANSVSTANVVAKSTFPGTSVVYKLVSGKLPYGLSLIEDGEIIGKVRQFSSNDELGITIFDNGFLTLDNTATTLDRSYTFTIEARDKFTINAVQRKFTINITPLADRAYSNLYIRPLLAPAKKKEWSEFISNSNVFSTDIIYRPYDENFGIQRNLTSLIYSGIEAKGYGEFAAVTAFGHKPRSLLLGNLKVAEAREAAQDDVTYEVLYLELLDPYEKFSTGNLEDLVSAAETVILKTPSKPITADQTGADFIKGIIDPEDALYNRQDPAFFRANEQPLTVDSDVNPDAPNKKHISTITNMRNRIQTVGLTDNRFLPLWMKTRQTATGKQPGYVRAVPIAYAKPGTGQQLLLKVNNYIASSDFEFSNFNYFVDRYVIDATLGNSNTQFIVWPKNNKSI
jgi:hypothetical protein